MAMYGTTLRSEARMWYNVVCFHPYKIIHGVYMHEPEGTKKNQLGPLLAFHFHIFTGPVPSQEHHNL